MVAVVGLGDILGWIKGIFSTLDTIAEWFVSLASTVVKVILWIPSIVNTLTTSIAFLPPIFLVFGYMAIVFMALTLIFKVI